LGRQINLQIDSWQTIADHFPGLQPIANLEHDLDIEYRSYQALAVASVIFSGFRGVVRAATGSGKTLIAAAICGAFLPQRSLVLIHGRELHRQTYEEFVKFLGKEHVGVISANEFAPNKITIASVDALTFYLGTVPTKKKTGVPTMDPKVFRAEQDKFLKYLDSEVDMLVFDEVHHGSADSWQNVGKKTKAYHRVGLSGTPLKHDELSDMLMMSLVGPVVYDLQASWLQKRGYLAQARLEIRYLDYTTPKSRGLVYHEARKNLLVENNPRHAHIAGDIYKAIQDPNTKLLVLTGNSVPMAECIAEDLEALARPLTRRLGFSPFTMVTGKSNSKKVTKAFNDLRKGNVRCVITTKIADEGLDIPGINTLFLVGGGKAYVSTVQRIGRGLRTKEAGEELLVVDYFTLGNKYMEKHDKARLKVYEAEDFFYQIDLNHAP
jgi:superfamily II DNA or RNA helicase